MNALTVRRIAVALLSAALWGFATRILFVPLVIASTEIAWAWMNRGDPRPEPLLTTLAKPVIMGGCWAAIGMLVFRR